MIDILRDEIVRTMQLLQVNSLADLTPEHVTQLTRLVPRDSTGRTVSTAEAP